MHAVRERTNVFITMPERGLVRSTDRDYLHILLPELARQYPVSFTHNATLTSRLYEDGRAVVSRIAGLLGSKHFEREHIWTVARIPEGHS